MNIRCVFIPLLFAASLLLINGQSFTFSFHPMGETNGNHLGQSSLVDMDNDGYLDFVVGSSGGTVCWFEYIGPDNWLLHKIGDNALTDRGGVTIDVDGDGLLDHVAGGCWYRNTGDPKAPFERFENGVIYAYDMVVGDINSDGKPDILAMSPQEGIFWYDIPANPRRKWKGIRIGDGTYGGIAPMGIADLDNDGDMDIVRSNVWFNNLDGKGTKWRVHRTISFVDNQGKFANSARVHAVDWDSDGDTDLVIADANNPIGKIAWLSNKDGKGINWFVHTIDNNTKQDLHSLIVADFDNDGDLDIFSGGGPLTSDLHKRLFIWENINGLGTDWKRHEILTDMECVDAVAGDVDGDGDIDIICKPWQDKTPYYLQNLLINK